MALSNTDLVTELYIGYYNRAPDPVGLNFWLGALAGGESLTTVANQFANSSESLALYPYLSLPLVTSPTSFVTQVYNNILNRAPDALGLAFWVGQLQAGTTTAGAFIATLEASVNLQTGTADSIVLANKLAVAENYTNAILTNNVPFSQASAHAALAPVSGIGNTPTTSTQVAAGEAVTAAYVSNPNGGTPIILTTGLDSPTLPGNSNIVLGTFDSVAGGAQATYTAGDNLIGAVGSTGNTLTLSDNATGGTGNPSGVAATVTNFSVLNINSTEALTVNTTAGFGGVTALNANASSAGNGNTTITAPATTAITLTDAALGNETDTVNGGLNVVMNSAGNTTGGAIIVGTTAAPVGTVAITNSIASTQTGANTAASITEKGGTTVTITENLTETAGLGNTVTGGAVSVTGTSTTTSVTVNQTAASTAAAATVANPGVAQTVGATAAGPGVQGVAATTQTATSVAKAAVAGVVDGAVTISDANAASTTLANTITSVTLSNFGAATINDNALANLSLTGGKGSTITINTAAAGVGSSTLALALNGGGTTASAVTLADTNSEIKTINATVTANETMVITDSNLAALTIAGTAGTLSLSSFNTAKLATVTVSGAAGFNDGGDLAGLGSTLTSFTTTSSGTITATLNDTAQTFIGSTGQDIITISADATKTITGGSATNNELILNAAATTFTAAKTGANVTGFQVLGLNANSAGAVNMSNLSSSFKSIDFDANGSAGGNTYTVTNAAAGTALSIDATGDTISVTNADANGSGDSTTVTINPNGAAAGSSSSAGFSTASLTLQDANSVGIANVSIVSNGSDVGNAGGANNTIVALVDNGISSLTVTGGAGLTIGSLTQSGLHQTTSLTIASNETGLDGTVITTLSDNVLGSITFTGSNSTTIGSLTNTNNVGNLTLSNTGTGAVAIDPASSFVDSALATLTLSGNVALNTNSGTAATATGVTTGVTVSGQTDNAHVNINLTGAVAASTDTITLGNGNDFITDGSSAGHVSVTAGTGYNLIDLHTGAASTYAATVALGSHTDTVTLWDQVNVGTVQASAILPNTVITGAVTGDVVFVTDATAAAQISSANQTAITNTANTLTAAINIADTGLAAHAATAFQFQGNTYIVENHTGTGNGVLTTGDTLVELVGLHTISSTLVATHGIALAS